MKQYELVFSTLGKLKIPYNVIDHPAALTTEEADMYIEGIEGVRTKTLFLSNRKKTTYYLVIMDGSKRLDMKNLGQLINEKGMTFGKSEKLMEKMSLSPGTVSLFGLLNNDKKDIRVCINNEMLSEKFISFHPNDNTKTVFISTEDMFRFIEELGYEFSIINL